MRNAFEHETTVLNGFPVLVKFAVCPAEPDVGIMSAYVDEYELCSVKTGKDLGQWIYDRVQKTEGEEDKLFESCYDYLYGLSEDYQEDW